MPDETDQESRRDAGPVPVLRVDGVPHAWVGGRLIPVIAGGDGTGEGGGEGDPPSGGSQGNEGGAGSGEGAKTYDEAYVKKLRDEAAAHRTKVRELEAQLKTLPNETLSKVLTALGLEPDPNKHLEQQLAEAKSAADQATQTANQRLIAAEARAQAAALGIKPERIAHAIKLADLSGVTVGADGEADAAAINAALEHVLTELPELKGASGGTSATNGHNSHGARYTREQLAAMSPAEIDAQWPAIAASLAKG